MCKKFNINVKGSGTQAQIITSLKHLENEINNTPKPLTRITAKFITTELRRAYNTNNLIEFSELIKDNNLPQDYCITCACITPTIRTYKKCICALCGGDRLQDISLKYQDPIINADITETDTND